MAEPLTLPPPGFDDLSVDEQIEYVQRLWDRISSHVEQAPLPEWQRQLLDERLEAHCKAPSRARPWRESLDRIRDQLENPDR
jgi:putative addiction module component (TIGR02574 family)